MRSGPSALQSSVRLGRSACGLAPTAHSAHIRPPCKRKGGVRIELYAFAFAYPGGQTSHTTGTLCKIGATRYWKNVVNYSIRSILRNMYDIAIIGLGPAGATLARLVDKKKVTVHRA
jgi:hypothetical protein